MNRRLSTLSPLMAALIAAFALGACSRQGDSQTAGQKVDETVAKVEQKADEVKAETAANTESAKASMKEAGQDIKAAAQSAGDKVGGAVSDAAITTAINAELAKDQKLSALKINVDTAQGRVALRGTAPDLESKERASRIAIAVQGVRGVDNLLTVDAKS